MTTLTVTATQGTNSANGMCMRIRVLTGVQNAASQIASAAQASAGAGTVSSVSITTTAAGSLVYGALGNEQTCVTGEPSTTIVDNFQDTIAGQYYGTFRTTAVTGTPGATLVGSTVSGNFGSIAAQEILPSGTITQDASEPASQPYTTNSAKTLTSASFTPVAGSLIVVMVQCDGAASGFETCTVTDTGGGLTWHQLANTSGITASLYAGVWIADVPGGAVSAPSALVQRGRLRRRRGHGRRQQLQASPGQPGFEGWGGPL